MTAVDLSPNIAVMGHTDSKTVTRFKARRVWLVAAFVGLGGLASLVIAVASTTLV
jgi:hypothetical protein